MVMAVKAAEVLAALGHQSGHELRTLNTGMAKMELHLQLIFSTTLHLHQKSDSQSALAQNVQQLKMEILVPTTTQQSIL